VQDNSIFFKKLSVEDLAEIAALEVVAWPEYMRASNVKIEQRLQWQHVMLGAFKSNQLVGIAAWRYDHFDRAMPMPESFDAFANRPNAISHNAAYVYNFAIVPSLRNKRLGRELALKLIAEGIKILIADRCTYLIGASRCPSYAGSNEKQSYCSQSVELQAAIDGYKLQDSGSVDASLPWQYDPVLSFYKQALNCTFVQILPAFMPEDNASGGYAIGFCKTLGAIHEV
jgi:hypothetical protein